MEEDTERKPTDPTIIILSETQNGHLKIQNAKLEEWTPTSKDCFKILKDIVRDSTLPKYEQQKTNGSNFQSTGDPMKDMALQIFGELGPKVAQGLVGSFFTGR